MRVDSGKYDNVVSFAGVALVVSIDVAKWRVKLDHYCGLLSLLWVVSRYVSRLPTTRSNARVESIMRSHLSAMPIAENGTMMASESTAMRMNSAFSGQNSL